MQISGSIGVTILKNNDKIIILLADDHSNSSYCDNEGFKNHQSIKDYLEKELNDGNQILLEEVPRDGFELQELWPESPHTQSLKNFFLEDNNVTGIDIRPYLVPFSLDIIDSDSRFGKIMAIDYINKLNEFFNLSGKYYDNIFKDCVEKVIIKNSGLGKNLQFIVNKFNKIKKRILEENKNMEYYNTNEKNFLEEISKLCDEIMEFNTILRAFSSRDKSIIHAGLFHSHNMLEWLKNEYSFDIIYENGLNDYKKFSTQKYNSCVKLPNELFGLKD